MPYHKVSDAPLNGFKGPVYNNIDVLNLVFCLYADSNLDLLELSVRGIKGYRPSIIGADFVTDDDYKWRAHVSFELPNGKIILAVPKREDQRSLAFYYNQALNVTDTDQIIIQLCNNLISHCEIGTPLTTK